jgi:hypothetical protein
VAVGYQLNALTDVHVARRSIFLSPLRGWFLMIHLSHGLRRGLYSFAASRLETIGFVFHQRLD